MKRERERESRIPSESMRCLLSATRAAHLLLHGELQQRELGRGAEQHRAVGIECERRAMASVVHVDALVAATSENDSAAIDGHHEPRRPVPAVSGQKRLAAPDAHRAVERRRGDQVHARRRWREGHARDGVSVLTQAAAPQRVLVLRTATHAAAGSLVLARLGLRRASSTSRGLRRLGGCLLRRRRCRGRGSIGLAAAQQQHNNDGHHGHRQADPGSGVDRGHYEQWPRLRQQQRCEDDTRTTNEEERERARSAAVLLLLRVVVVVSARARSALALALSVRHAIRPRSSLARCRRGMRHGRCCSCQLPAGGARG